MRTLRPSLRGMAALLIALGVWGTARSEPVAAWAPQGHRIVARLAWAHVTPATRRAVAALIGPESLWDVAAWADDIRGREPRTAPWHYVNIPRGASAYEAVRDCPPASGGGRWRDCVVDRILEAEQDLARRDRPADARARALRFLVHLVGDVHQPLHAIDVARGGNDIIVRVAGRSDCGPDGRGGRRPCSLHGVWDGTLLARRRMTDAALVRRLERAILANGWRAGQGGPETWALEANQLAARVLVASGTTVDAAYIRAVEDDVDRQVALAGLRLAAVLDRAVR